MGLTIPLSMTDEQYDAFIKEVAAEVVKQAPYYGKRTKPYSVQEFQEVSGIPLSTIYRDIKAGRIRTVKDTSAKLIPASELERFL